MSRYAPRFNVDLRRAVKSLVTMAGAYGGYRVGRATNPNKKSKTGNQYSKALTTVKNVVKAVARTRQLLKNKSKTDTNQQQNFGGPRDMLTFAHGRPLKISSAFVKAVKMAASNNNTQQFETAYTPSTSAINAQGSFVVDLCNNADLKTILQNIGSTLSTKCILESCSLKLKMVNQESAVVDLVIYECVARHDIPISQTSAFAIWQNGFNDDSPSGIQNGDIAATPYNNPRFCSYFRVIKQRQISLSGGQTFDMNLIVNYPQSINAEIMNNSDAYGERGRLRFFLVRHCGQVVNDATTKTIVGTTKTKIDYLALKKYNYRWTADSSNSTYTTNSLGSVVTPERINPVTEALESAPIEG